MAQPSMMLISTITPLADADSGADAAGLAGGPADPPAPSRGAVVLAAVSIFAVAFAVRLLPMVGGGGLLGLGNYSDVGILYITHDLLSARMLSDEVVVLNDGQVVEQGHRWR